MEITKAKIQLLKNSNLVGGTDDTIVYPVTTTQAVFSQGANGEVPSGKKKRLEDRLQKIEGDILDINTGGLSNIFYDNTQSQLVLTLGKKRYRWSATEETLPDTAMYYGLMTDDGIQTVWSELSASSFPVSFTVMYKANYAGIFDNNLHGRLVFKYPQSFGQLTSIEQFGFDMLSSFDAVVQDDYYIYTMKEGEDVDLLNAQFTFKI